MGVSAWLLSRAAEHPPVLYLEVAAVGVRFFGISRGVFRYAERLVGHDVALRMQSALRLETYRRLARTTLLGTRRGDLLTTVIADVEAVQDLIVRVVIPFASASLVILATSAMLGVFSPGSAAVLLVSSVLAGAVVPLLAQRASRRADAAAVPARGRSRPPSTSCRGPRRTSSRTVPTAPTWSSCWPSTTSCGRSRRGRRGSGAWRRLPRCWPPGSRSWRRW